MDLTTLTSAEAEAGAIGALLGAFAGFLFLIIIIALVALILEIIGMWKMFEKAGEHGWAALIPFYNLYVLMKIGKLEWFHFLIVMVLAFVSGIANGAKITALESLCSLGILAYTFVIYIKAAKAFGKSAGFGVFTVFFACIGFMILGCGSAEYQK